MSPHFQSVVIVADGRAQVSLEYRIVLDPVKLPPGQSAPACACIVGWWTPSTSCAGETLCGEVGSEQTAGCCAPHTLIGSIGKFWKLKKNYLETVLT